MGYVLWCYMCVYIMSDYGEKHIVMKAYYLNLVTYILHDMYKWNY